MPAFLAVFAVLAVVFFALEGCNVASPRFNPLGWGLACFALVVLMPVLRALDS